jgi:hypothetical protein
MMAAKAKFNESLSTPGNLDLDLSGVYNYLRKVKVPPSETLPVSLCSVVFGTLCGVFMASLA